MQLTDIFALGYLGVGLLVAYPLMPNSSPIDRSVGAAMLYLITSLFWPLLIVLAMIVLIGDEWRGQ